MRASRLVVLGAATLVLLASLASEVACRQIPQATCDPDKLDGEPPGDAHTACNSCLEDHCCDAVGNCAGDLACVASVFGAHSCVVGAGLGAAKSEKACTSALVDGGSSASVEAYRCMRASCGKECGLPTCTVSAAAIEIVTPSCDTCLSGACCDAINACYGNRLCKLQVECIYKTCPEEFTRAAGAPGDSGPNVSIATIDELARGSCTGQIGAPPLPPPGVVVPLGCIEQCVRDYPEDGLVLDPAQSAQCLSTTLFACAAHAGCGSSCILDAGAD